MDDQENTSQSTLAQSVTDIFQAADDKDVARAQALVNEYATSTDLALELAQALVAEAQERGLDPQALMSLTIPEEQEDADGTTDGGSELSDDCTADPVVDADEATAAEPEVVDPESDQG